MMVGLIFFPFRTQSRKGHISMLQQIPLLLRRRLCFPLRSQIAYLWFCLCNRKGTVRQCDNALDIRDDSDILQCYGRSVRRSRLYVRREHTPFPLLTPTAKRRRLTIASFRITRINIYSNISRGASNIKRTHKKNRHNGGFLFSELLGDHVCDLIDAIQVIVRQRRENALQG